MTVKNIKCMKGTYKKFPRIEVCGEIVDWKDSKNCAILASGYNDAVEHIETMIKNRIDELGLRNSEGWHGIKERIAELKHMLGEK